MPWTYQHFEVSQALTISVYLRLNTNHFRNFRSNDLSQDKRCKVINQ